jgi:hypothetical protein
MKSLLLATITAIGIGLLGISGASAAPIAGAVIGQAAGAEQLMQQAHIIIIHRRHRHCHWWRHHLVCHWW